LQVRNYENNHYFYSLQPAEGEAFIIDVANGADAILAMFCGLQPRDDSLAARVYATASVMDV
jgi:hypothetical protein